MSYFKYYFDTSDLKLSLGAEKLLNIFRDRYELSSKKGFKGKNGNVVFLIKLDEIASLLGKSKITAFRMVDELREKGLIFTQKRQSGILEFSLNTNFNIIKNDNTDIIKNDKMEIIKNDNIHIIKNDNSYTYKPDTLSQPTKPNARTHTHEPSQEGPSQNEQNERASSHPFSQGEQGNSRIPSQDKTQEPSTKRVWLEMSDKPSYISEQVWQDFCCYKRERRHNFTATGKKAFIAKLDEIQAQSNACEQAIKNTIANGWQGVFMPRLDKKQATRTPAQTLDALQDWLSDRTADIAECVETPALPSRCERRA